MSWQNRAGCGCLDMGEPTTMPAGDRWQVSCLDHALQDQTAGLVPRPCPTKSASRVAWVNLLTRGVTACRQVAHVLLSFRNDNVVAEPCGVRLPGHGGTDEDARWRSMAGLVPRPCPTRSDGRSRASTMPYKSRWQVSCLDHALQDQTAGLVARPCPTRSDGRSRGSTMPYKIRRQVSWLDHALQDQMAGLVPRPCPTRADGRSRGLTVPGKCAYQAAHRFRGR